MVVWLYSDCTTPQYSLSYSRLEHCRFLSYVGAAAILSVSALQSTDSSPGSSQSRAREVPPPVRNNF